MWALDNRTPYAADRTWVRDKQGVHHWIVAVKATFQIAPDGTLTLADEQIPPVLMPEWHGKPGASSLKYDMDVGPLKPTTDVLVNGQAHAPKGRAAESVPVRLRIGKIEKSLVVYGERFYETSPLGTVLTTPKRFVSKPIRYEDAWGGTDHSDPDASKHAHDPRNPVGRGFAVRSKTLHQTPAHTVEYGLGGASSACPAGFGAIDRGWLPRLKHAGTYDADWVNHKKPLLPDDYDPRYELCSPDDQRVREHIYGGELLELTHLTPEGLLRLTLPKVYLTFETRRGSSAEQHRGKLSAVVVEPDEKRLMLVWQTGLRVAARHVEHLDQTIIREKPYLT